MITPGPPGTNGPDGAHKIIELGERLERLARELDALPLTGRERREVGRALDGAAHRAATLAAGWRSNGQGQKGGGFA